MLVFVFVLDGGYGVIIVFDIDLILFFEMRVKVDVLKFICDFELGYCSLYLVFFVI